MTAAAAAPVTSPIPEDGTRPGRRRRTRTTPDEATRSPVAVRFLTPYSLGEKRHYGPVEPPAWDAASAAAAAEPEEM